MNQRGWIPHRRPPGAASGQAAPAGRLGALWLPSGPSSGPWFLPMHGFSLFLREFSGTSKYPFSCTQENHTGSSAENSVSLG